MTQCITCLSYIPEIPHKGYGVCRTTGERMEAMVIHKCVKYKLGPIKQVRARTKRMMTFDSNNNAVIT